MTPDPAARCNGAWIPLRSERRPLCRQCARTDYGNAHSSYIAAALVNGQCRNFQPREQKS